jgi:hypothetical protein
MFAVIFQSRVSDGYTQVAYVPHKGKTLGFIRHLSGDTSQRGISGAWSPLTVLHVTGGLALGEPVAISITSSDLRDLDLLPKPTTLLQKLVRAVQTETSETGRSTGEVSTELLATIEQGAEALSLFTKPYTAQRRANRPVSIVVAEPVAQPVVEVVAQPVAVVATEVNEFAGIAPHQTKDDLPRRWASLRVPTKSDKHISRTIDGMPMPEVFEIARQNGESYLLTGEAGTGKTSEVENYAASKGLPFVRFECLFDITADHIQGRLTPMPNADGSTRWEWHYSELATIIQQEGVVLFNELSRTPSRNAGLFLGLLQERQLSIPMLNEVIQVHPKCLFVADQNLGSDYTGATKQDSALLDRFTKVEFEDDPAIEAQLIPSPSFLEFAEAIRFVNRTDRGKMRTRVGLRMLLKFVEHSKNYNYQFAVSRLLANFNVSERATVRMHFDTRYDAIASELGIDASTYTPAESI